MQQAIGKQADGRRGAVEEVMPAEQLVKHDLVDRGHQADAEKDAGQKRGARVPACVFHARTFRDPAGQGNTAFARIRPRPYLRSGNLRTRDIPYKDFPYGLSRFPLTWEKSVT